MSLKQLKEEAVADFETPTASYDHTTQFMMTGIAAIGAALSQLKLGNSNLALISGAASLAYAASGVYMMQGNRRDAYRMGAASSLAMMAAFGPRVLGKRAVVAGHPVDNISNALFSVSAFHGAHCLLNVYYQMRPDKNSVVP